MSYTEFTNNQITPNSARIMGFLIIGGVMGVISAIATFI